MAQSPTDVVATPTDAPASSDDGGGVFDFNDLQALREEYEERIARLERERDASFDIMRKESDNRIASMRIAHEQQIATDAKMRQDLIEELTIELADAREDGERHAVESDRRRAIAEANLHIAQNEHRAQLEALRDDVARSEAELARIRATLDAALAPVEPAPAPLEVQPATPASPQQALPRTATPPPVPADAGGTRKRKNPPALARAAPRSRFAHGSRVMAKSSQPMPPPSSMAVKRIARVPAGTAGALSSATTGVREISAPASSRKATTPGSPWMSGAGTANDRERSVLANESFMPVELQKPPPTGFMHRMFGGDAAWLAAPSAATSMTVTAKAGSSGANTTAGPS